MKRSLFLIMLVSLLLCVISHESLVHAKRAEFQTSEMKPSEQQECLSDLCFSYLEKEPRKEKSIQCFDVNNEGYYAVGTINSNSAYVSVYNPFRVFQYGFEFVCNGKYALQLDNTCITIYLYEEHVAVCVSQDSEEIKTSKIAVTAENDNLWNTLLYDRDITVNGVRYYVHVKSCIIPRTSMLIEKQPNGNETILYGENDDAKIAIVVISIAGICILSVFLIIYYRLWVFWLQAYDVQELWDMGFGSKLNSAIIRILAKMLHVNTKEGESLTVGNTIDVLYEKARIEHMSPSLTERNVEYYFMGLLARSSYVMEGTLVSKEIVFRKKSTALTWEKYEFERLRDISGRYMNNRLILHDPRNRQITPFEIGRRYILVVTKLQGEYAPDGSDLYQGSQIRCRLSIDRPEVIDFLEVAGCRAHFMGTRKEFIRRIEEVGLVRKRISG